VAWALLSFVLPGDSTSFPRPSLAAHSAWLFFLEDSESERLGSGILDWGEGGEAGDRMLSLLLSW
jgi:hypothetical protein